MQSEIKVKQINELETLAQTLLDKLGKTNCMALYGNLGAGKTSLAGQIAKRLGIKRPVNSPTFVIMKEYDTQDRKFKKLVHIDAYRLSSTDDIKAFNLQDILNDKSNLVLIEWPERFKSDLPSDCLEVYIDIVSDDERIFRIKY